MLTTFSLYAWKHENCLLICCTSHYAWHIGMDTCR
jgi:hypothetical protein